MKPNRLIILILALLLPFVGCKKKSKARKTYFTPLRKAVGVGNIEEIRRLAAEGADVNVKDQWGDTPLHGVARRGDPNVIRVLVAVGADIDTRNNEGDTPLMKASKEFSTEMVEALIAAGADINAQGLFLNTPLHWAAERGCRPIVEVLIDGGANVDSRNRRGETPAVLARNTGQKGIVELLVSKGAYVSLHTAAYLGDLEKVGSLIARGTGVNGEDAERRTALHFAAPERHMEVVRLLLANGADPNARERVSGATPLHLATKAGHREIVELLLDHRADVDARYDRINITPLQIAASQGHMELVALLVAHGADVNAKDESMWEKSDWTPLRYAIENGHSGVVQLLLDNGARPDETDRRGRNLATIAMNRDDRESVDLLLAAGASITIHLAAYLGNAEQVRSFVENGVDVNLKDEAERTPLYVAVQSGHKRVVELLLAAGADVNARNWDKSTPMHEAAGGGRRDMVELLVAKGALLDAHCFGGATPLHWATGEGRKDIVEFLLARGADINAERWSGKTALSMAAQFGHEQVVELLLARGADIKLGAMGRDLPHSEIDDVEVKELAEYLINRYGPYSVIVADPKGVREFLRFHGMYFDDLWTPRRDDIEDIDAALRSHMRNGTLIGTKPSFDRKAILANLDQYCREYCGIIRGQDRYIVCQMIHCSMDFPMTPPEKGLTGIHGFSNGVVRFIFEVKSKRIVHIDCEYVM